MTKTTLHNNPAKRILIVEDEGEMCLVLNILLNGEKMELDHVNNLKAANEYLQKQQPSLVILDNRLPDGFGVDLVAPIKKEYPGIKIIMMSGVDGAVKDVALENGANAFLEKPFTKTQLQQ